ncbi:helix-turn-helix domain-containing protein [Amycolatopsis sp. cmx-11-32]|uniref:helix-turn-helix domain-containing protein n=1 Tax=Amycolatopsis sp. cmx-11-32 TaxID=2785796 RepID=UPI0039E35940
MAHTIARHPLNTKREKNFSTAKRRELGAELRRIRKRAGYLGVNMASMLNWGEPAISHLENGTRRPPEGRVALYLARAKATTEEFERLVALDRFPDDGYQARPHPTGFPDSLPIVTLLDDESSSFASYDALEIPWCLQIEPYIRIVLRKHGYEDGPALDAAVRARLTRQPASMCKPGPFTFYIPERALLANSGRAEVIHEQLVHLSILSSLPGCHIHLVPADALVADLCIGFTLYRHDEHPPVVHHQLPTASLFLEQVRDVGYYEGQLERLAELALDRRETREWLTRTLADVERRLAHGRFLASSLVNNATTAGS